jgi:hypothetical protein
MLVNVALSDMLGEFKCFSAEKQDNLDRGRAVFFHG